jgi:predicted carbohydrate-binding protein with CBM5 and CBM33 domain
MLDRVVKGSGLPDTSEFFNNPERPDELLTAENEILNNVVEQMQSQIQQLQNPLAEAEQIKAQAKLVEAQGKRELDIGQMLEDQRQFNLEMAQKQDETNKQIAIKLTEIEAKFASEQNANYDQNEQTVAD